MATDYSNYDMLDRMIANNRKAKSWTAFWVIALCLLAGAVLYMAFDILDKKKMIVSQQLDLETKIQLIDSLRKNCNSEKTAILQSYDSVIGQTQEAISALIKPVGTITTAGVGISANQRAKLVQANTSLKKVKYDLYDMKKIIKEEQTKIFIQYNNKSDADKVSKLIAALKNMGNYYVAPAEYIGSNFPTVIKLYNHKTTGDEKDMMATVARHFGISTKEIQVKNETNKKLKDVIEIWIDTKD